MDATRWHDRFLGGAICLDFINTIERLGTRQEEDRFTSYGAILAWSMIRGTMPPEALSRLRDKANADPAGAHEAWRAGVGLRRTLRRLMTAIMEGKHTELMLDLFNRRLALLPAEPPITFQGGVFRHHLTGETFDEPLRPVMWSAVALLTENQTDRVGQCQAENCRYLFLDLSRNQSRRWCSADSCGNRERVRRAYRAEKVEPASGL